MWALSLTVTYINLISSWSIQYRKKSCVDINSFIIQLIYCNPWRGAKLICRRKAIKQPSSRGLCLKVTLGGQIDGISDGANGLELGIRQEGRTWSHMQLQIYWTWARCRATGTVTPSCFKSLSTIPWTPFQLMGRLMGLISLASVCTEKARAALSLQLCSAHVPPFFHCPELGAVRYVLLSRSEDFNILHQKKQTNKQTAVSNWGPCWDPCAIGWA